MPMPACVHTRTRVWHTSCATITTLTKVFKRSPPAPFPLSLFLSHTSDIRNHNSRELTIIRKVLGDLHALRESIVRDFDVSEKHVVVKVPF